MSRQQELNIHFYIEAKKIMLFFAIQKKVVQQHFKSSKIVCSQKSTYINRAIAGFNKKKQSSIQNILIGSEF
jgi:hypothetical protein